jgi:hypothetical protein
MPLSFVQGVDNAIPPFNRNPARRPYVLKELVEGCTDWGFCTFEQLRKNAVRSYSTPII